MTLPTTSVIVVSWQRPDALVLCLQSLVRQRLAPAYEIIVVADAAGLAAVASLPDAAQMKLVACDRPNISAARNLGVAVAAGQVVAFEPPPLNWSTTMFRKRRTRNGKQAAEARRDRYKVTPS